jgi:Ser/Thr protein kinase RdoA (MazF antagonist)
MNYLALDEDGQVAEVSKLIPGILAQYNIKPIAIENVNHSYNSSFKITDDKGNSHALRINLGSGKSEAEVLAEMQWLEQLAQNQVIHAPIPVRTTSNDLYTKTHFEALNADLSSVLFEWIEGEDISDEASNEQLFEVGKNMAKLQIFANDLKFTPPAFLPTINRTMMNAKDNLSNNQPSSIDDKLYSDLLKGLELTEEVYDRLSKNQELLPIHADMHVGNVIQTNTNLAIIDFDDAGLGLPIQDLVISNYYIREDTEREKHLKAGYSSILELPKVSDEDYELLLLSRMILLVNAVLDMTSAEIIEFLPTFMKRTQLRLDHFFATGQLLLKK